MSYPNVMQVWLLEYWYIVCFYLVSFSFLEFGLSISGWRCDDSWVGVFG
jgi:hypothetical protein